MENPERPVGGDGTGGDRGGGDGRGDGGGGDKQEPTASPPPQRHELIGDPNLLLVMLFVGLLFAMQQMMASSRCTC